MSSSIYRAVNTTLIYIECGGEYLMLHRTKKENDCNRDKWIGIGGKFESGESPEECALREAKEETGLTLTSYRYRGIVTFVSDRWEPEYMHLFTADGFDGALKDCDEGELAWIKKKDLLALPAKDMVGIRGNDISMIFQEPMTSLNPIKTCGKQIMEPMFLHTSISKEEAKAKAVELLRLCGIPDPEQRFHEYPHQMSGGMRQRIMIAMALACNPKLLIADEPTTALDVTIQAQILELMKKLKDSHDMGIILITHDLGIVADFCDRVLIFYTGQIVESAPVRDLFREPLHPYTKGLIRALPKISEQTDRLEAIEGMVPDADQMPEGCHFHPRCPYATDRCRKEAPALTQTPDGRCVRCFLYGEVTA